MNTEQIVIERIKAKVQHNKRKLIKIIAQHIVK